MAIFKIEGDSAGNATYTLKTPSGSSNRIITLPDSAGTLLNEGSTLDSTKLSATGTASATTFLRGDNSWVVPTDTDTVYTHPTGDGNIHVPAYGSSTSGQLLTSTGTSSTPTWQAAPQGVSNSKLFYFGSFT
jgi:hypothetical protein